MSKPATVPRTREWLNGAERGRLRELEATLDRGARMDLECGQALAEIRDQRLYRESHATFEEFCRQPRWNLSRARAYQLIDLAGVVAAVHNVDTPSPASEAVARELAPLRDDPEAMRETWGEAVEQHGPAPTAEQVRDIRSPPPATSTRTDTRFDVIESATALLRQLPADVGDIRWPSDQGDIEVVERELAWLAGWAPKANQAFKRHRREQRRPRAVA